MLNSNDASIVGECIGSTHCGAIRGDAKRGVIREVVGASCCKRVSSHLAAMHVGDNIDGIVEALAQLTSDFASNSQCLTRRSEAGS